MQTQAIPSKKGKNLSLDEERQLTRSVLAVSQDPIAGNQQNVSLIGRGFVLTSMMLLLVWIIEVLDL